MKRWIVLLYTLLLLLPVVHASADVDSEIVFHNIPWGISINELETQLEDRGIKINVDDIRDKQRMAVWSYDFISPDVFEESGYRIYFYLYEEDKMPKVAGHLVNQMDFYAHYGLNNEELSLDADDSCYYMVKCGFNVHDEKAPAVYNDLAKKLTRLYGDGSSDVVFYDVGDGYTYNYIIWNGSEDTAVCLCHREDGDGEFHCVDLMYGHKNIEETLKKVRKLVIENEIASVANDTEGL